MTRARILADYVSGGTTAAEFDYLDGVTSNIQTQFTAKAPLASPAFTGTPTGITAAHLEAGVLPSYVTGGSGLTALGTVTSGTIGGAVTFENGKTLRNIEEDYLTSNISKSGTGSGGATTEFTVFTPTYTPKFIGSQVTGTFYAMMETDNIGGSDGRGYCKLEFTGSGITNWTASTLSLIHI